jgi:hypothetical protein
MDSCSPFVKAPALLSHGGHQLNLALNCLVQQLSLTTARALVLNSGVFKNPY